MSKVLVIFLLLFSLQSVADVHDVVNEGDILTLNLQQGDYVNVESTKAKYEVRVGNSQVGDLFYQGYVLELKPYDKFKFNVLHFDNFNDAANRAEAYMKSKGSANLYGHVFVPSGQYCLQSPTPKASWHIAAGAEFNCQTNYPNVIDNISHLKGNVFKESSRGRNSTWLFGDSSFDEYIKIRNSVTPSAAGKLTVVGEESGAIVGYASTGQYNASEGHIAIQGYCVNSSIRLQNCWAGYFEGIRLPNAGAVTTLEVTTVEHNPWNAYKRILPSGDYGANSGITVGMNISGGVNSGKYTADYGSHKIGAGIMFTSGTGGKGMDAGIVCLDRALAHSTAKECIRMGVGQYLLWHGAGFNPKGGIRVLTDAQGNGQLHLDIWGNTGKKTFKFTKDGLVLPSGTILN